MTVRTIGILASVVFWAFTDCASATVTEDIIEPQLIYHSERGAFTDSFDFEVESRFDDLDSKPGVSLQLEIRPIELGNVLQLSDFEIEVISGEGSTLLTAAYMGPNATYSRYFHVVDVGDYTLNISAVADGQLGGAYTVDFISYLPIPEPAPYLSLLLGLSIVGFFARRRTIISPRKISET